MKVENMLNLQLVTSESKPIPAIATNKIALIIELRLKVQFEHVLIINS